MERRDSFDSVEDEVSKRPRRDVQFNRNNIFDQYLIARRNLGDVRERYVEYKRYYIHKRTEYLQAAATYRDYVPAIYLDKLSMIIQEVYKFCSRFLVDPKDLVSAITLNASGYNIIGHAIPIVCVKRFVGFWTRLFWGGAFRTGITRLGERCWGVWFTCESQIGFPTAHKARVQIEPPPPPHVQANDERVDWFRRGEWW